MSISKLKFKWVLLILIAVLPVFFNFDFKKPKQESKALEKLSEYGFFTGDLKSQTPAEDVIPYDLNTPLFSDYAFKLRFIRIPRGKKAAWRNDEVFDFPEGTCIIKTFYYPLDFRKPQEARRIMETRLLIRDEKGWQAYPYVWNEEQNEAYLDVAGAIKPLSWTHSDGKKRGINYVVPNKNQCKSCHEFNGKLIPIGPSARQLNKSFEYVDGSKNQLQKWKELGILDSLPPFSKIAALPVWNKPETGSVAERARAYLDANCGHCHRAEGQASTSGLFLNITEQDPVKLGIRKPPVAAGRAAADMRFSIDPGNPDKSIMIYRMHSLDPGIMMPELGRRTIDEEGLLLLKQWIAEM